MKKKSKSIAKEVLSELDWFGQGFKVTGGSAVVESEMRARMSEPFVAWVRVMESIDRKEETERIYLVCRGYRPSDFDPKNKIADFANRDSRVGRIASIDPGDDITIAFKTGKKTIRVIEKDIFLPIKSKLWDARNNQIAFHLDDEYVPSLRAELGISAPLPARIEPALLEMPQRDGKETLDELRRLENEQEQTRLEMVEQKLQRVREIVESIALKDQPILDANQDEFCRKPLKSQLILAGSPGTGKTTSIIKRIAMKADQYHLKETDEIELSKDERTNWLIFTPNDLLKIYLKEAMNKEGLSATDQFVTTWEKERTILGRDVFGFLKRKDKGIFSKTEDKLLSDTSSLGVTGTALGFLNYVGVDFVTALKTAIEELWKVEVNADILTKETFPIADKFRSFVSGCRSLQSILDSPTDEAGLLRSIRAVAELSKLSTIYSEVRSNTDEIISGLVDSWIEENPIGFNDIVDYVQASSEENKPSATDIFEDAAEEDIEEVELDHPQIDPRLRARNRIRQILASQAEAIASGKLIRGKGAKFISEFVGISEASPNELLLAGKLRLALKPGILKVNSFNRFLARIPRTFQRFRLDATDREKSRYSPNSHDAIRAFRVSPEEIDIMIFVMFRTASLTSEFGGEQYKVESGRDLLAKVADQCRTHIAVDEATDFSAIQLASIYYLTHPRYRAITFSGDLMQRVTTGGLTDWHELDELIPSIKTFDLVASYRQTPTLLKIAKKLYTTIIGKEPPFDSKHVRPGNFPSPLKYRGVLDVALAEWLAERIHEIYQINGEKLPSIAVFVPSESDIDPAHQILKEALNEYSIDVEACKLGKILGTGSNIRIFSIEFIKGLEFEGVFYIDIDRSYENDPELLDKYLYVGLTRATTFLGVTYSTKLPLTFEFLEEDLVSGDWRSYLR